VLYRTIMGYAMTLHDSNATFPFTDIFTAAKETCPSIMHEVRTRCRVVGRLVISDLMIIIL